MAYDRPEAGFRSSTQPTPLEQFVAAQTVPAQPTALVAAAVREYLTERGYLPGPWLHAIAATNETLLCAPDHVMAFGNQGAWLRKLADLQQQRGDTSAACERLRAARTLLDRAPTLAPNKKNLAAERARVADLLRLLDPPPDPGPVA